MLADLIACNSHLHLVFGKDHENTTQRSEGTGCLLARNGFSVTNTNQETGKRKALTWTRHATSRISPAPLWNKNPTNTTYLVWRALAEWFSFPICCKSHWLQNEVDDSVQQFTPAPGIVGHPDIGRVSLIILLIAALGIVRSSSLPDEEAIAPSLSRPDF